MGRGGPGVTFQCVACRALVVSSSIVLDRRQERAALCCSACGASSWLPLARGDEARVVDVETPAARAEPLPALPQPGALVVSGASSVFAPAQQERIADRLLKLPPTEPQRPLAEAFERLLGDWHSESEHKQFLKRAALEGELAFAGQRYRLILDEAPGDAHAKRAQNEILSLAMASMSQQKDLGGVGPSGTRPVAAVVALAVVFGLLVAAIYFVPRLLRDVTEGATMDVE